MFDFWTLYNYRVTQNKESLNKGPVKQRKAASEIDLHTKFLQTLIFISRKIHFSINDTYIEH